MIFVGSHMWPTFEESGHIYVEVLHVRMSALRKRLGWFVASTSHIKRVRSKHTFCNLRFDCNSEGVLLVEALPVVKVLPIVCPRRQVFGFLFIELFFSVGFFTVSYGTNRRLSGGPTRVR